MVMLSDRISLPAGLPSPEQRPDGSWIVWMVLAVPGVMDYAEHGAVYVPASTLQDRAWLDSLAGVPLIDDDEGAHAEGVTLDERSRIGTILSAGWSDAEQGVVARAVVDTQRGLDKIRAGVTGVSPAYETDLDDIPGVAPDGTPYLRVQARRRASDNVAITDKPRGGERARLQADAQEAGMTPEEMKAMITQVVEEVLAARESAAAPAPVTAPDADPEAEEPKPATLADYRAALTAASDAGVELDETMTLDAALEAVASAANGDKPSGLSPDSLRAFARGLALRGSQRKPGATGGAFVGDATGTKSKLINPSGSAVAADVL
jgi:hypothetical protein